LIVMAAVVGAVLGAGNASAAMIVPSVPWGNDFTCRPTAAHPRPVVLVHGLGATADTNWSYIGPQLHDAGYCVFALTYGIDPRTAAFGAPGGVLRMEDSSADLAKLVRRVRRASGAKRVDLVGHSEGTVMPRYYLERRGGARFVRRFVALTPLWRGTELGGLAMLRDNTGPLGPAAADLVASLCASCPEFLEGSPFLNDLNADGEKVPGIRHVNIATRNDELVSPYTSGIMADGGKNIVLQDMCPNDVSEHGAVAFDPAVAALVLNALAPKGPQRTPC
jgi:triacylglycerol esterase/lipase EstA (alpha/beta hydrolase family)